MLVTSVLGHILQVDIDAGYGWGKCDPADCFFKAPLVTNVGKVGRAWRRRRSKLLRLRNQLPRQYRLS
jgi:hypothetical protein